MCFSVITASSMTRMNLWRMISNTKGSTLMIRSPRTG